MPRSFDFALTRSAQDDTLFYCRHNASLKAEVDERVILRADEARDAEGEQKDADDVERDRAAEGARELLERAAQDRERERERRDDRETGDKERHVLGEDACPVITNDVPADYSMSRLNKLLGIQEENEKYYAHVRKCCKNYRRVNRRKILSNFMQMKPHDSWGIIMEFVRKRI